MFYLGLKKTLCGLQYQDIYIFIYERSFCMMQNYLYLQERNLIDMICADSVPWEAEEICAGVEF